LGRTFAYHRCRRVQEKLDNLNEINDSGCANRGKLPIVNKAELAAVANRPTDQTLTRKQRLLALALDAERTADRLLSAQDYEKAEKFRKLAETYRAMAREAADG
jgi:hypothetical protein